MIDVVLYGGNKTYDKRQTTRPRKWNNKKRAREQTNERTGEQATDNDDNDTDEDHGDNHCEDDYSFNAETKLIGAMSKGSWTHSKFQ